MFKLSYTAGGTLIGVSPSGILYKEHPESDTLSTIVNNKYLRMSSWWSRNFNFISTYPAIKTYTHDQAETNVLLYNFYSLHSKVAMRRWVAQGNFEIVNEIYVPNIRKNGRGIWLIGYRSTLAQIQYGKYVTRNKYINFTLHPLIRLEST